MHGGPARSSQIWNIDETAGHYIMWLIMHAWFGNVLHQKSVLHDH